MKTEYTIASLQSLLEHGIELSGVPGASLALWHRGESLAVAAGLANAHTGVEVTPDTIFQIGSITKPFTATLVMQLIEAGKLNLDDTLADQLPEFQPADPGAAAKITIRQLLCHSSGLDGDRLIDCGRGDDYLEKFVAACAGMELLHEPGAMFSYCNAGYIFLGRIIEKLSGLSWDEALMRNVLQPLALQHAGTLPEQFLTERMAIGHSPAENDTEWSLEPLWPRSNSPSGARLAMTASELVRFAQIHLPGPQSDILNQDSATAMQQPVIHTPLSNRYHAWGLGWMHFYPEEQRIFGHNGGVAGTASFLRILPDHNLIIALMTNGPNYHTLFTKVMGTLLHSLTGIDMLYKPLVEAADIPRDLDQYTGRFERHGLWLEVEASDGKLMCRYGGEYNSDEPTVFPIIPVSREVFSTRLPGIDTDIATYYLQFDLDGRPEYVHFADRTFKRVSE